MSATQPSFADVLITDLEEAGEAYRDSNHQPCDDLRSLARDRLHKARTDIRQALTVPRVDPEDDFLRDQFAMAALQGLIQLRGTSSIRQECADAYNYSDQMMLARKGKG